MNGCSIKSTCPYCGVGCGIIASRVDNDDVCIKGDPEHPANFGRLCSKGAALAETIDLNDRLLSPEVNGNQVSWNEALSKVSNTLQQSIKKYGAESVAFYVSGQLLTEDYYVANKLMKGFIGTANIDTNSRLCMSSAVAGHKRAFGSDTVACDYNDLEKANLVVLIGSNTAWCHPVIYQRIIKAKNENPGFKIVVIDPRRTITCEEADLYLPLKAGTDTVLFNGLLNYLRREDALDWEFLEQNTEGFSAAIKTAAENAPSIPVVAEKCQLSEQDTAEFYRMFTHTDKVVSLFSQGVNQSSSGTDKVNAIINCHLATGRIGREGMGPFSITGQPNAMGGREVGGLANQLAAHMEIENPVHRDRVQRFWSSPVIAKKPGLKAVDLFDAVHRGEIKVLWIMATNPAVSLPNAEHVREAIQKCDTVIVSDCNHSTDTTREADILLPALSWGEKEGTVTNSERCISRQRAFLTLPGEARPDWWIITQVARRMGFAKSFPYESPVEIFREHAALSGFENKGERDFDISVYAGLDNADYERLKPQKWPINKNQGKDHRLFSDGRFFHPGGKAKLIAINPREPVYSTNEQFPLILNTGRVRDHWHTMTRTGKSPRLSEHINEPYVDIHPDTAYRFDLEANVLACIKSQWGEVIARVKLSSHQRQDSLFIPMHWNDQYASKGKVDAVVNPATDPVSGQPELKHTPVTISKMNTQWEGFFMTCHEITSRTAPYWIRSRGHEHWYYLIAGKESPDNWSAWAKSLLQADAFQADWIEYSDSTIGRYRAACIRNDKLESCLFIAPDFSQLPDRSWLKSLFEEETLTKIKRACLLAGKPANDMQSCGPTVCSCFNTGRDTIIETIIKGNITDVKDIGKSLHAGTNCGSCIPEIKQLINKHAISSNVA